MEFTMSLDVPFNLDYTLESGQVFRWRNTGEWWQGIVGGGVLKLRQEGDMLKCIGSSDSLDSAFVSSYFRLDEDLEGILATFPRDKTLTEAVERYYGLRLIRQEGWECLASFVLATNANIPRIQKMIAEVSSRFGRPFQFEGETHYAFPSSGDLASAPVPALRASGLGYRAPFLKRVAASVAKGRVDFEKVETLPYEESRRLLLSEIFGRKLLLGVGPKVADCVLLFSFGKDEACPIDVWVARTILRAYPKLLRVSLRARLKRDRRAKLSASEYYAVSKSVREYFGRYAGYAQQYLFMAAREPRS